MIFINFVVLLLVVGVGFVLFCLVLLWGCWSGWFWLVFVESWCVVVGGGGGGVFSIVVCFWVFGVVVVFVGYVL